MGQYRERQRWHEAEEKAPGHCVTDGHAEKVIAVTESDEEEECQSPQNLATPAMNCAVAAEFENDAKRNV